MNYFYFPQSRGTSGKCFFFSFFFLFFDGWIDGLIDWLIDGWMDGRTDGLTDWLTDWLTDSLSEAIGAKLPKVYLLLSRKQEKTYDMRQPGENFHVNFIIGLFLLSFKGTEKFADDIQDMIGHRPNMYFRLCWKYISPIIIGVSMTCLSYTVNIWNRVLL